MDAIENALKFLKTEVDNKEKRNILSFDEFLQLVKDSPQKVLRSIFQMFNDMVNSYVGEGTDEYPGDPESIGFVSYDCSRIFVAGADKPFFADRLFANRFIRMVSDLMQGSRQNKVYVFEGPRGCGKSTFLNNTLQKFEEYTDTPEGRRFEIFWQIDESIFPKLAGAGDDYRPGIIEVFCPSHDHPILIIPKNYRVRFLDQLLPEVNETKLNIFSEKEYEWVFRNEPCTICKSLFWALFDKFGSLGKVLGMVKARQYKFDRSLGEGISVFNPGDQPIREIYLSDKQIQERLDRIFGANIVKYVFSPLARTNNGICALMDIKGYNKDRLLNLHNVISDGVQKVNGAIEESIDSLFVALMNPEDKETIREEEKMQSFQERVQFCQISYTLEPSAEVNIYRSVFGNNIDGFFLPRVLENFTRVIISSRMNRECKSLNEWIGNIGKYKKYCDKDGLLLRIEIYSGNIPDWLLEEDKKRFKAQIRRQLIAEAANEGRGGFTGRESIELFGDFLNRYSLKSRLIGMSDIMNYFKVQIGEEKRDSYIPNGFLNALGNSYDYAVLNEVKEALYFYNKEQINEDILNYLCAVSHKPGSKIRCQYTDREIDVTIDFLKMMAGYIAGKPISNDEAVAYALDIQQKYVVIIAQDPSINITETELYQDIFNAYVKNLKEKALQPFVENESFREAIRVFGTEEFEAFDNRIKKNIKHMIGKLVEQFGYNEQGAKEVCLYVIDQNLTGKFS